ncbi:MAG TPA: radical SAM protein [Smithellaceae bacterium]|jgi:Fe-coproporphyrin III synthase|nr:radical SAM protein [Smithellaceae bacterium]HQM45628.1 radical SAM protein [Smithellaceae bacterium]
MKIARLPWPLDLTRFFWMRKVMGQSVPLLASFKVTYRCNLSCLACPFHRQPDYKKNDLSWEKACTAMEFLRSLGVRMIVFEGGEPLLWRDQERRFHDLVRYARERFLRVAVTTNGTFPLDIPADVLWVSLDGLKEVHDELRSNSFDLIYANLKDTGHPRVFIHCTLNRRNWRGVESLALWVKSIPSVKGMTVQFFYPYGQGEENIALLPDERRTAIAKLISLKRRGLPILNSQRCLRAMAENRWRCHDDVLINVDPDGTVSQGCYVKTRGRINCDACGFTPVAEASGALDLIPGSLWAGWQIFLKS